MSGHSLLACLGALLLAGRADAQPCPVWICGTPTPTRTRTRTPTPSPAPPTATATAAVPTPILPPSPTSTPRPGVNQLTILLGTYVIGAEDARLGSDAAVEIVIGGTPHRLIRRPSGIWSDENGKCWSIGASPVTIRWTGAAGADEGTVQDFTPRVLLAEGSGSIDTLTIQHPTPVALVARRIR